MIGEQGLFECAITRLLSSRECVLDIPLFLLKWGNL